MLLNISGRQKDPLEWSARQKIAVGAARGLRYLHEECRVGCIIHRDMRPNNILITHDFEPLVGYCFASSAQCRVIVYILKDTSTSLFNIHLSTVFFPLPSVH